MDTEKSGKLIAAQRKQLNMKQSELAARLNVSDKTVSKWETGRGFPDVSIIEDLCDVLHISAYDLLKGELSESEEKEVFEGGIGLFRKIAEQKKIRSFFLGLLLGMSVLILAFVHLNAPVYMNDPATAVKIEELDNGKLIAIIDQQADGYEISYSELEGESEVFVSAYKTKMGSFKKNREEKIVLLKDKKDIDRIWYYPTSDGDVLIYGKPMSGGVVTLSRLIYNNWIFASAAILILLTIAYFVIKDAYHKVLLLKYGIFPFGSFLASMLLVLFGNFGKIYNAAYYFSAIVLLAIFLYLLILLLYKRKRSLKS